LTEKTYILFRKYFG